MTTVIRAMQASLLAALVVLVAFTCVWVETLNRVTSELPLVADRAIAREGTLTRAAAERQIIALTGKLDLQIGSLRHDLFTRVDSFQTKTFTELDQIRADANAQITETRTAAVAEIAKVSTPAGAALSESKPLMVEAQHILTNASQTSDLLLDCDHNPDCFANRVIPALKSTERMAKAGERTMDAISEATPETANAVKSTSQDLSRIVKKFSQPVSWMKGFAGTAAYVIGKFLGL